MDQQIELAAQQTLDSKPKLEIDTSKLNIVKAPDLGSVLPLEFYAGAGELVLSDEQQALIAESEDCPDDEIDVRPEDPGLIYVRHGWYERKLNRIFGPGAWSMIPATDVRLERETEKVYVMWVLRARGTDGRSCFIGQAMGWARLQPDNPRTNKADAFEITRSDAIVKIVAKTLGVGSNLWDRRFARKWRNLNCIKVKVRTFKGTEEMWRRKDEEPFDGEIQTTASAPDRTPPARQEPAPEAKPAPKSRPAASRPPAETEPKAAAPPPAGSPSGATQQQIRMFLGRARVKKLITAQSADEAVKFVSEGLGRDVRRPGHTGTEDIIEALKTCGQKEFHNLVSALDHYRG